MEISSYIKNCFKMFAFSENAFKNIKQEANFKTAFSVYMILLLISTIIQLVKILIDFFQNRWSNTDIFLIYIIMIVLIVIFYFIQITIVHLFFKLFKGKGSIKDTLRGMLAVTVPITIFSIAIFLLITLITILFEANPIFDVIWSLISKKLSFGVNSVVSVILSLVFIGLVFGVNSVVYLILSLVFVVLVFGVNSVVSVILSLVFIGLIFAPAIYSTAVEIKLFTYIHEISIGKSAAAVLSPYILVVLGIILSFIPDAIIETLIFF